MDLLSEFLKSPIIQGTGILVIGMLAQKMGLPIVPFIKRYFGINGNGNKEIEALKSQVTLLQENHIHNLEEKLDKLMEKENEGNLISKEILMVLKEKKRR